MSTNAEHLAQRVRERRSELDLSQLDVWQAGGPSNTTLTEIENGRLEKLTRTTAKRLDVGLKWEAGSAKAVWEGGEPTPILPGTTSKTSAWLREQIGDVALDDNTRQRLLEVLDEQDRRRSG